jgi:hypothetical protein
LQPDFHTDADSVIEVPLVRSNDSTRIEFSEEVRKVRKVRKVRRVRIPASAPAPATESDDGQKSKV